MYSVGIVPVMVRIVIPTSGSNTAAASPPPDWSLHAMQVSAAAAYSQTGALDWARFAALFVGAVLVIAWLNLRWGYVR
jgi:hypothetical protein